jgi:aryl-alcohol dehydrogenase-like predicted oxidoreductase
MEKLGNLTLSELGIGTWAWGDRIVWGYQGSGDDTKLQETFQKVLDLGINWFDTAEMYGFGQSERLLGQFLQGHDAFIATKFGPVPWRLRESQFIDALKRSLKRLNRDHVDLYQIHWILPPVPYTTWVGALGQAAKEGLARNAGVSNYNVEQTQRAHDVLAKYGVPLASNQVEYHLLDRSIEQNGLLDLCNKLGVRIIAYSPLAMGILTGKYTPENVPPGVRGRQYPRQYLADIQPLIGLMREVGTAHGAKTPAQVAINWTICKGTIPIPGAKHIKQAEDNAGAMGWRLSPDEVAALDAAADKIQAERAKARSA